MRLPRLLIVCTASAIASYSIGAGGELVPDTASFASGGSAWSSPLLAAAGQLAGISGVQTVAALALVALGTILWVRSSAIGAFVVYCGPWAPALACAGADAAGAAAVCVAVMARRLGLAPAAALLHLAAGLAALAALAMTKARVPFAYGLAIAAVLEVVILRTHAFGLLPPSTSATEIQWRYLLPALAVAAIRPLADPDSDGMPLNRETAGCQPDRFEAFDAMERAGARYSTE